MTTIGQIVTAIFVWGSCVAAGQETLRDVARRQHGRVESYVIREFSPVDVPELAKNCDFIVRAVVLDGGRSHLSKDEQSMYSDYTVQVLGKIFGRVPGDPGERVIITKPGGTLVIEGYQVTTVERDFPPFEVGEEYVLFLRLDPSTGQYVVPYGAQGAFRNAGGVVEQVSRNTGTWNSERGRVPMMVFLEELSVLKPR